MKKTTFQEAHKKMYFNYLKTQLQHLFVLKTHLEELVTCFKTSLFIYTISSNVSHERSNFTQTTNIQCSI